MLFPNTNRYFISINVTFFEDYSFSVVVPHVFEFLILTLVLSSLDQPSPSQDALPQPLQFFTCRPSINIEPLTDSSHMPSSSMAPVLPSTDNLPIALWKDTCSSCNSYPIYNFPSYHFIFHHTLSYVSILKTINETLSHSVGDRQWLKKCSNGT